MAAAAVDTIPSYNRLDPGSKRLEFASYPKAPEPPERDVENIARTWVESFNKSLSTNDIQAITSLFLKDGCWRDQLCLSWTYHTLSGPQKIQSFLEGAPKGCRIKSIDIDGKKPSLAPHVSPADYLGKVKSVAAFLTVDTDIGRGRGVVRLIQDADAKWKAYTLFTAMFELKGHEETINSNRPAGVEHGGQLGRKNWQERRTITENFEDDLQPTVLIIGWCWVQGYIII